MIIPGGVHTGNVILSEMEHVDKGRYVFTDTKNGRSQHGTIEYNLTIFPYRYEQEFDPKKERTFLRLYVILAANDIEQKILDLYELN